MPRARNTTDAEIRDLVAKIQVFTEPNYVNRSDFRQSNLDALRAFPDKALKAFYVRKILKIPGSIGAEVFGITTGLISQAEATEVTVSRSGRERQPNAYSAANRSEDVSGGFFRKSTTSYERFGFGVTNVDRLFIFTNFARLAIVNNRGADVVSFQPRMVASYMAESDALNFKNVTLPNWRDEVALVMGGQDAPSSVGAAQPEATASRPETTASNSLVYQVTSAGVQTMGAQNAAINRLINAGTDRDQATALVEGLANRSFNFTTPGRQGSTIDYRLQYFGNTLNKPDSESIKSFIAEKMRLDAGQVTMRVLGGDLAGQFTLGRAETAPSQPESTATPVLEYTRLMREVGYPEMFATELLGDLNGAEVEILSANSIFDGQGLDVFVQSRNTDVIGLRSLIRANWNQLGSNQGVTTQGFPSVNVLDPNRYVIRIGIPENYGLQAESGSTVSLETTEPESSTASTASTATATAPVQEEVDTTYDGIETRYPNLISRVDYTTIRNSGYSRIQARSLLDFINSYGLRVMSISVRSGVGRSPSFLRINVRGVNSSARSFRNTTFLRFLRGMRSVAEDSAVQVLSPSGRFYQSATFRGTGRGQTPVGALIIPIYSQQAQATASASQPTSQPMTPTGGVNRQIVYLGNVQGTANRIYRGGPKRFYTNGIFGGDGGQDFYSAIAFFYDPSQGSMPGSILTAPLGTIARDAGLNFTDVMNYLASLGRFENPGKLKAYFVRENAKNVAQGIVGATQNTFTPVRPTGAAKEIAVDRVRLYTPSEFAQWASTEPMLGVFRGIAGEGTSQGTSAITLLSTSQLKTLATSPYSFGFGVEFEGFIRQGTRKQLSQKMRADGIKIYTTIGYQSKTPVSGEEPYVRGHDWRQESDSSVQGYDARESGGYDRSGQGQTFEMVSKVLNSSSDNKSGNNSWIPYMENFCESLAKNGVLIDPSSGIHIHVGYPNFNAEQTKNLFINSVLMIPVLKGLVSEAWKSRSYAKFPNNSNLTGKLSQIANATGDQSRVVRAYESAFGSQRYSYLNTSNFGRSSKPTFEYRFQGSSIEKDTMVNTIRILQQIWKASLEGVIPIKEGYGKEQDQVLVDLLGTELFSFARNRYAETSLPNVTDRSSKRFPGFKFPINASSIT